MSPSDHQHYC